jgi:hypothetical protein
MHFLNRNFSHFLFIFLIILSIAGCSNSQQSAQIKIDKIANGMKGKLPIMLDANTKLVNVYTKKLELVSEYKLVNHITSDDDNQKNKIDFYLKNTVCPGIKKELLSKGISSRYIYKGKEGKVILDRLLSSDDC